MAALSGGNGYTTEAYGESLKKRIAEINEHLTVYANRGRIVGQVATKADADAWTAQKKALENEYAAWERGMYAAGQEKALSALPDEDLKLIDRYLDEKQFAANPVQTTLDPLGVSDSDSATYRKLYEVWPGQGPGLIEYREQQKNESRQTAINKTVADYASSGGVAGRGGLRRVHCDKRAFDSRHDRFGCKGRSESNSHARVDINNPLNTIQNFTRSSRGGVSSAILGGDPENAPFGRQAGNLLYQTLMSGLDSAVAMTIGGKSANYLLGATAATNAMQDITERGGTLEQAVTGGIAAGVFECIFEKYSIGNFIS